jgi:FkbM family methyltransferase
MIRTLLRPLSRAVRAFIGTDGLSTAVGHSLQMASALAESNARLHSRLAEIEKKLRTPGEAGEVSTVDVAGLDALEFETHERPDQYISVAIRRDGQFEPHILAVVRAMTRVGDTMLDIGANIGWFSVIGSRLVGPRGRLVAVEPDPVNFAILRRNLSRNACHNVTAHQLAAGASETTARLYLSPDGNQGDHRMAVASDRRDWVEVPVRRIDALLNGVARVDVVKMDTQGSEVRVLQGMPATLAANPMLRMVLEFWPHGLVQCGSSAEEFSKLLSARPSVLWLMRNDGRMSRVTAQRLVELARTDYSPESEAHGDVVAVHADDTELIARLDATV